MLHMDGGYECNIIVPDGGECVSKSELHEKWTISLLLNKKKKKWTLASEQDY